MEFHSGAYTKSGPAGRLVAGFPPKLAYDRPRIYGSLAANSQVNVVPE